MVEAIFFLFKVLCVGASVWLVFIFMWDILTDRKSRQSKLDGCDHDWETIEETTRARIRQDLARKPSSDQDRPSCREEFLGSIPRLGESSLEKRICLKCGQIDDEIAAYVFHAIEERKRLAARKNRVAELLAEAEGGEEKK